MGVGIGRVPSCQAEARRFQRVKAFFLDLGGELGGETGRARRLLGDHHPSGLVHRCGDGLDIVGDQRYEIDDLHIKARMLGCGLGHMHQRAIGDERAGRAFAHHFGLAQLHRVATLGHLALGMARPGGERLVGHAVERAIIDALGFKKDHRIAALHRRD